MILSEMTVLRNQNKAREEPVSWILNSFNLIEWNQIVGPVCFLGHLSHLSDTLHKLKIWTFSDNPVGLELCSLEVDFRSKYNPNLIAYFIKIRYLI